MGLFKKKRIPVFLTRKPDILNMARTILRENGIPFSETKGKAPMAVDDSEEVFQILVPVPQAETARNALRSLMELDSILCGQM